MKRILLPMAALAVIIFAQSCAQCAKCNNQGDIDTYCVGEYTQQEIADQEEACVFNGGSWTDAQ